MLERKRLSRPTNGHLPPHEISTTELPDVRMCCERGTRSPYPLTQAGLPPLSHSRTPNLPSNSRILSAYVTQNPSTFRRGKQGYSSCSRRVPPLDTNLVPHPAGQPYTRCKSLPPSPSLQRRSPRSTLSSAPANISIPFQRPYSNQCHLYMSHSPVSHTSFDSPSPYSTTRVPHVLLNPTLNHCSHATCVVGPSTTPSDFQRRLHSLTESTQDLLLPEKSADFSLGACLPPPPQFWM